MNTKNTFSIYTANFEIAIAFVLGEEGGYVNDPADTGGETKYGISKKAYPNLDIKNLTIGQAKAIYYDEQPIRGDQLPAAVACAVLDMAVNMGVKRAGRELQRSLKLRVDGIIGPKTITASRRQPVLSYLGDFLSRRACRYHRIAKINVQNGRFIRGWLKRCFELQQYLYEARLL